jgi:hypothetical protein
MRDVQSTDDRKSCLCCWCARALAAAMSRFSTFGNSMMYPATRGADPVLTDPFSGSPVGDGLSSQTVPAGGTRTLLDIVGRVKGDDFNLVDFMGPPYPGYVSDQRERAVEYSELPAAYIGKQNLYWSTYIIKQLTKADEFWVRVLMPFADASTAMTIEFDQWEFHTATLDREPEQAPSRTTTYTYRKKKGALVRYGKQAEVSQAFFKTVPGRREFAMKMMAIAISTRETMCLGVANCVYNTRGTPTPEESRLLRNQSAADFRQRVRKEIDWSAFINKNSQSLPALLDYARDQLRDRKCPVDDLCAILPCGARASYVRQPTHTQVQFTGNATKFQDDLRLGDFRIFESRKFTENRETSFDPAFSNESIGNFLVMGADISSIPPSEFRTDHHSIYKYSLDKRDDTKISYTAALRASGIIDFDKHDCPVTPLGRGFFQTFTDIHAMYEETDTLSYFVSQLMSRGASVVRGALGLFNTAELAATVPDSFPSTGVSHGAAPSAATSAAANSARTVSERQDDAKAPPDASAASGSAPSSAVIQKALRESAAFLSALQGLDVAAVLSAEEKKSWAQVSDVADGAVFKDLLKDGPVASYAKLPGGGKFSVVVPHVLQAARRLDGVDRGTEFKVNNSSIQAAWALLETLGTQAKWTAIKAKAGSAEMRKSVHALELLLNHWSFQLGQSPAEADAALAAAFSDAADGTAGRPDHPLPNVLAMPELQWFQQMKVDAARDASGLGANAFAAAEPIIVAEIQCLANTHPNNLAAQLTVRKEELRVFSKLMCFLAFRREILKARWKLHADYAHASQTLDAILDSFRTRSSDSGLPGAKISSVAAAATVEAKMATVQFNAEPDADSTPEKLFGDMKKDPRGGSTMINVDTEVHLRDAFKRLAQNVGIGHSSTGKFVKFCLDHDLFIPIRILLLEPHQTYIAGCLVVVPGGGTLGKVFVGHADGQFASDVDRKQVVYHFNIYAKAFTDQEDWVFRFQNVFFTRYRSGMGHRLWDACSPVDVAKYQSGKTRDNKSIFACAVAWDWQPPDTIMDINGFFNPKHVKDATNNDSVDCAHYHTAALYSKHWGFSHPADQPPPGYPSSPDDSRQAAKRGTVVTWGYQRDWDHGTKNWTRLHKNTGHLGPNVGPGLDAALGDTIVKSFPVTHGWLNTHVTVPGVF